MILYDIKGLNEITVQEAAEYWRKGMYLEMTQDMRIKIYIRE